MKTLTHTILSAFAPRTARPRQRTGKIARLPKSVRERINHLLDEGCEYSAILKDLGPHAAGLNHQNLTNWRKGGYQDHLQHQALLDRTKAQTEAAAELVHEMADVTVPQLLEACDKVAVPQLLDVIVEHGETALARTLKQQPAKYLNLMNITCNMSNAAIKAEQHRMAMSSSKSSSCSSSSSIPNPSPKEKEKANLELIASIQAELRKRYYGSSSENPIKPNQTSKNFPEQPAIKKAPSSSPVLGTTEMKSRRLETSCPINTQNIQPDDLASVIPSPFNPNQASANDRHSSAGRLPAENHPIPLTNTGDSKLIVIDILSTGGMKSRPAAKPGRILTPPLSPTHGPRKLHKRAPSYSLSWGRRRLRASSRPDAKRSLRSALSAVERAITRILGPTSAFVAFSLVPRHSSLLLITP